VKTMTTADSKAVCWRQCFKTYDALWWFFGVAHRGRSGRVGAFIARCWAAAEPRWAPLHPVVHHHMRPRLRLGPSMGTRRVAPRLAPRPLYGHASGALCPALDCCDSAGDAERRFIYIINTMGLARAVRRTRARASNTDHGNRDSGRKSGRTQRWCTRGYPWERAREKRR
jgi:hypothetical protein